jgi:O-antigen/teichoic acid export membrane protein
MTPQPTAADPAVMWRETHQARTIAFSASARWITIAVELMLGLVMLPFNTRYLGAEDYGLWMLAASIVAYFPVLDLGYAGAMDRFIAHYRAKRDARAINEIASTLFVVFAAIGVVAMFAVVVVALNAGRLFSLAPDQLHPARVVMLLIGVQFAVGLPFAAYGGVVNGFQRTYRNAIVGTVVALAVASVNVAVLVAGGGLIELVAATTATRMLGYIAYRLNGYRVFPLLTVRPSLFSRARLREVTGFSVYILIQNGSNKINYATDPVLIGAFVSTAAVAVWTVAQRLADMVMRVTNQLNDVLFPVVVECDSTKRNDRMREVLLQGTKISLGLALPAAGTLALLAEPVIVAWTGRQFIESVVLVQILVVVVLVRVGTATAATVLKGGGHHRLLAWSNSAAAAANIVLSVILLQIYGLPGVAVATLIPILIRSVTVVVPVACARVGVPVRAFLTQAIWPALWPGLVALGALAVVRDEVRSLLDVVLYGGATTVVYVLLFVGVAMGSAERRRYLTKLRSITGLPVLRAA